MNKSAILIFALLFVVVLAPKSDAGTWLQCPSDVGYCQSPVGSLYYCYVKSGWSTTTLGTTNALCSNPTTSLDGTTCYFNGKCSTDKTTADDCSYTTCTLNPGQACTTQGCVSGKVITLTASPASVKADGTDTSTITATATDNNVLQDNVVITFASGRNTDVFSSTTCTTTTGKCAVTVKSSADGAATITGSATAYLSGQTVVTFNPILLQTNPSLSLAISTDSPSYLPGSLIKVTGSVTSGTDAIGSAIFSITSVKDSNNNEKCSEFFISCPKTCTTDSTGKCDITGSILYTSAFGTYAISGAAVKTGYQQASSTNSFNVISGTGGTIGPSCNTQCSAWTNGACVSNTQRQQTRVCPIGSTCATTQTINDAGCQIGDLKLFYWTDPRIISDYNILDGEPQISCTDKDFCMAVWGTGLSSASSSVMSASWNGKSWDGLGIVDPTTYIGDGRRHDVSCSSRSFCMTTSDHLITGAYDVATAFPWTPSSGWWSYPADENSQGKALPFGYSLGRNPQISCTSDLCMILYNTNSHAQIPNSLFYLYYDITGGLWNLGTSGIYWQSQGTSYDGLPLSCTNNDVCSHADISQIHFDNSLDATLRTWDKTTNKWSALGYLWENSKLYLGPLSCARNEQFCMLNWQDNNNVNYYSFGTQPSYYSFDSQPSSNGIRINVPISTLSCSSSKNCISLSAKNGDIYNSRWDGNSQHSFSKDAPIKSTSIYDFAPSVSCPTDDYCIAVWQSGIAPDGAGNKILYSIGTPEPLCIYSLMTSVGKTNVFQGKEKYWDMTLQDNSLKGCGSSVQYTLENVVVDSKCDASTGIYKYQKISPANKIDVTSPLALQMSTDGTNNAFTVYAKTKGSDTCTITFNLKDPTGKIVDPSFTVIPPNIPNQAPYVGLFSFSGDTSKLTNSWEALYPDNNPTRDMKVKCGLNCDPEVQDCSAIAGESCVLYDASQGTAEIKKGSCSVQSPAYDYSAANKVTCLFYDPANVGLKTRTTNEFTPVDFNAKTSDTVTATVGRPTELKIDVANKGLVPDSYTITVTPPNGVGVTPDTIKTNKIASGDSLSAFISVTPLVGSADGATFNINVKSDTSGKMLSPPLTVRLNTGLLALPEFGLAGFLQIIIIAGIAYFLIANKTIGLNFKKRNKRR